MEEVPEVALLVRRAREVPRRGGDEDDWLRGKRVVEAVLLCAGGGGV